MGNLKVARTRPPLVHGVVKHGVSERDRAVGNASIDKKIIDSRLPDRLDQRAVGQVGLWSFLRMRVAAFGRTVRRRAHRVLCQHARNVIV
jgi:hypothetical protein